MDGEVAEFGALSDAAAEDEVAEEGPGSSEPTRGFGLRCRLLPASSVLIFIPGSVSSSTPWIAETAFVVHRKAAATES
jgi:hypothetical protein